jgi:hypothetical protein
LRACLLHGNRRIFETIRIPWTISCADFSPWTLAPKRLAFKGIDALKEIGLVNLAFDGLKGLGAM